MIDVDENMIKDYLKDIEYKKLIIDNDYFIELKGVLDGKVGCMPIVGWKRMWYGIHAITKYVKDTNEKYDAVLNYRWDNFICGSSKHIITERSTFYMLKKFLLKNNFKINFIRDCLFYGVDNAYVGNIIDLYNLADKFNFRLDDLNKKYKTYKNQEFLVYLECK
jgi:hypothetical protein